MKALQCLRCFLEEYSFEMQKKTSKKPIEKNCGMRVAKGGTICFH